MSRNLAERTVDRTLFAHFFRRFFDNDTVQPEGDTQTTVVRALAFVAVPSLMIAFFLQNSYPLRSGRDRMGDHYAFVLISFVTMGLVAIFEWEMLFPDRIDFLVLTPLSLRTRQMYVAKAAALAVFLGMFLVAANVFGCVLLPAVAHEGFWRLFFAHTAGVMLAGLFAVLFYLALGGVLLSVLSAAQFRVVSPLVQMFSVCGLIVFLAQPGLLTGYTPTYWFSGVYEVLLHGSQAPAVAHAMAQRGLVALALAAGATLLTYPLAWKRMRRTALEGASGNQRKPLRWPSALLHRVVRRPGERAVFHFIAQSILRNNRYQVYLAMYWGVGLAMTIIWIVSFRLHGGKLTAVVSQWGMLAATPLLLFWVIGGMRAAFGLPLNLSAGWIFRVTGVRMSECAAAARHWTMLCAALTECAVLVVFRLMGWHARQLLVQAGTAFWLILVLSNVFLFSQSHVPFNYPRMPGKQSFVLLLTAYVGVMPEFVLLMMLLEQRIESKPALGVEWSIFAALLCAGFAWWRRQSPPQEEDWAEFSGDYLLLGLGTR